MIAKSALIFALVGAGLGEASPAKAAATDHGHRSSTTLYSVADATVKQARPRMNFGRAQALSVGARPRAVSYVRFDRSRVVGTITQAVLRLYAWTSSRRGYRVHAVAGRTWRERTITYRNAPPRSRRSAASGAVTRRSWTSVDVTGLLQQTDAPTVALTTPGVARLRFASRDARARLRPRLVVRVESPPLCRSEAHATNEENSLTGQLSCSSDSQLAYTLGTGTSQGSVELRSDGAFVYAPRRDFNGPDSFAYRACVLRTPNVCAVGSVAVTVAPVNDPPECTSQTYVVDEDDSLSRSLSCTDVDDARLTYDVADGPLHGVLELTAGGEFVYRPPPNYHGPDTFVFRASDGHGAASTATASVTVRAVNDAPTANEDEVRTGSGTPVFVPARYNDSPGPGEEAEQALFADSIPTGPAHGTAEIVPAGPNAGTIRYTSAQDYVGADSFTYRACDDGDPVRCSNARVAVTVRAAAGVHFHCTWATYTDSQRMAMLDKLEAAGVEWVRIDIGWSSLQPDDAETWSDGHTAVVDNCIDWAHARGIKVLGELIWTPEWANGGKGRAYPPADLNDYANAAFWVANRWRGKVSAWEVWNEANLDDFWAGTDAEYFEMLKVAHPRFKAGDPAARVVFAGTAYNDAEYVDSAYRAGVRGFFDIVAVHPYEVPGDATPDDGECANRTDFECVSRVREVMRAYGDGEKPIWFTEYGWSTHANAPTCPDATDDWEQGVSEDKQAAYYVRAFDYANANFPYVSAMFWYSERDRGGNRCEHADNYGLVRYDLTEKPAYWAAKTYLAD